MSNLNEGMKEMAHMFKFIRAGKQTFEKMYTVNGIEIEKNSEYTLTEDELIAVEECKTENFIPWMSKVVLNKVEKYTIRRIRKNQDVSMQLLNKHYRNNMKAAVWEAQKCIGEVLIPMKKIMAGLNE